MGVIKQLLKIVPMFFCAFGIVVLSFSNLSAEPDPNFHIYIAYGQSNMEGNAKGFTEMDKEEHPRVKMFAATSCPNLGRPTVGEMYPAIPPMFKCYEGLSVADWFGRHMADSLPDVTIGIIPVAQGGTSIRLFDPDDYKNYLSTAADWLKSGVKAFGEDGNAMGRIIEVAKKAQKVGVIKGFIFHQGETDGGMSNWEKIVRKSYDYMLKELGLNEDETPFVAGEMVDGGSCAGFSSRVRGLSNYFSNFGVASSKGYGSAGDGLHFTVEGYRGMGLRYAQEMLKLINREPAVLIPREPYGGKMASIPGKIEAEHFDVPGTGAANKTYNDADSENKGDSDLRAKDAPGVDLYKKSNERIVVGYNQVGDWLEYTVNIATAGDYTMFAAVASANNTSSFKVSLDGKDITSEISVPKAKEGDENYDDYNKVSANVTLSEGEHILRFIVTGDWFDIDYFTFVSGKDAQDPEPIEEITPQFVNDLRFETSNKMSQFVVVDMQGCKVLSIKAKDIASAVEFSRKSVTKNMVSGGVYFVVSKAEGKRQMQKVVLYEK